jgi:nickel superoxide dismutase
MLHNLLKKLDEKESYKVASAHCDIPCRIYDPATTIIAALTVVRMDDIIAEWRENRPEDDAEYIATLSRAVARKEEHAEQVKHDIRIIWGDYIKAPQLETHPQLHELVHTIMLQGSACKQKFNREDAVKLVDLVNQFAEIFWETRNVRTKRAVCPYPPALEVVYTDL